MSIKLKKTLRTVCKVVLLVVGMGIVGFFVYEYLRIAPNDVRFTNVTSSSVTVSWNTKSPISATAVSFEGDTWLPLTVLGLGGERFYDTRDVRRAELEAVEKTAMNLYESEDLQPSMEDFEMEVEVVNMGEYYTHHVTVTGLDPETEYSFMIGDRFLYRKVRALDEISTVTTLEVPESVKSPVPAYGRILDAQGIEDPELLVPVVDGIVYFNLLDEFSEERSTVYSGRLNEEGNWYIDISGIRGEDGENFLNRYVDGETITNILAEINIDAGSLGRWEGILHSDFIAPAEMIVINDPLQVQGDGVGIGRVDSGILGKFVSEVEATTCTFAGYCGPCYILGGPVTNSCPCPQATLDARPGCKGKQSGTLEQAIANVAKASSGCANGSPGQHVWFGGDCKKCQVDERDDDGQVISYRWKSVGTENCSPENRDGRVFGPIEREDNGDATEDTDDEGGTSGNGWFISGRHTPNMRCKKLTRPAIQKEVEAGREFNSKTNCFAKIRELQGEEDPPDPASTIRYYIAGNRCKQIDLYHIRSTFNLPHFFTTSTECAGRLVQLFSSEEFGPHEAVSPAQECFEAGSGVSLFVYALDDKMYECKRGELKEYTFHSLTTKHNPYYCREFIEGNSQYCSSSFLSSRYCFDEKNDVMYQCISSKWTEVEGGRSIKAAIEPGEVIPGNPCDNPNGCLYKGGIIAEGVYAEEVSRCSIMTPGGGVPQHKDKVCKEDNIKHTCQDGECLPYTGDIQGVSDQSSKGNSILNSIFSYVQASTPNSSTEYIFDPETDMIVGIAPGLYTFEYEGQIYAFDITSSGHGTLIYIDKNNNGQYDEGIDIKVSDIASQINIVALSQTFNYQLREGFNFVSFPFLIPNEEFRTAAGLLKQLNEVYGDIIFSISRYDGGRWRIVGQNTVLYSNDDFQLLPGEGYVIKARGDVNISIVGQPVKYESIGDNAPINLYEGWNLVGLYGTRVKTYTAQSMLTDINASNFTADNVSKWEKDKQMYDGFQMSEGQEYGFDFPINRLESVFVRVLEGRGKWQPKLKTQ